MATSKRTAYAKALRASVYGLWSGRIDYNDFVDQVITAELTYLSEAYYEGSAKMGVRRDELTDEELRQLTTLIFEQFQYAHSLGQYVLRNSKANDRLLRSAQARLPMWLITFDKFVQLGMLAAKEDPKLKWVLGDAEHCSSCLKLAGKVKRKSQWIAADIYPKHSNLACSGRNCKCEWIPTDEPLSKGPLPKIP